MVKQIGNYKNPLLICFLLTLVAAGGFHIFSSAVLTAFLVGYLIYKAVKFGKIKFIINIYSVFFCFFAFMYLISVFWAVDSSSALFGFIKFLPVPLFLICIMQQQDGEKVRAQIIELIPYMGIFMTVCSSILMHIPIIGKYFSVAGRTAGFFQYPNTFALFLLIGILITGWKDEKIIIEIIKAGILLFGILYSGSRTVILMAVPVILILIFKRRNLKFTVLTISLIGVMLICAALYVIISGDINTFGRFLSISLKSSTLLGRLLYAKDALRLLLKNPFGLGYLGYYFMEPSIETGYYYTRFVHNDFLQTALDIGIIPLLFLLFIIIKFFFSREEKLLNKLIVSLICFHIILDFDFQFVSFVMLFSVLFPFEKGKTVYIKKKSAVILPAIIIGIISVYMGFIQFFNFIKCYDIADKLYFFGGYTETKINILSTDIDMETKNRIADEIIETNEYVSEAYNTKAVYAFSQGDFENVINYQERAIYLSPYNINLYNDYAYMLITGRELYLRNNDINSAEYCKEHLLGIETNLEELKEKTDSIAYLLKDKPVFELEENIGNAIKEIE